MWAIYFSACNPGQHGRNCTETCGHCIDGNTTCRATDGACPSGCAPGFNNALDITCKTGK